MNTYYIAWWNLENLFDVYGSPDRTDKIRRTVESELKGWNSTVLQRKIEQLSSIILQMNEGKGPDMLGVCEVENENVMWMLVEALKPLGRSYQVAHHSTQDARGIDIGFIYDADLFSAHEMFSHFILKRTASRDLFQVNFKTSRGTPLIIVGNHWPSKIGGDLKTEPYRILAAETMAYWHSRILEILGSDTCILFMGDFNDEPYSRSMTEYGLGTVNKAKVANTRSAPRSYNLMWEQAGQRKGTHFYDNIPSVIDHFLVSKGFLLKKGAFEVVENSVSIDAFPEMKRKGRYPRPIRFGRPSRKSSFNLNGFSDHFPISMQIVEK